MKKLLLIALLFLGFAACEVNPLPDIEDPEENISYDYDGVILGYDLRFCPCCGGVFIEIQNDTFRFYELPDTTFQFDASELPLDVSLNWAPKDTLCMGDEIDIHQIVKK